MAPVRDDLERATDDEHEGHHLGRGHDARDGRLQHRSGTLAQIDLLARLAIDERLVHLLVGTRHRHLAPVDPPSSRTFPTEQPTS